MDTTIKTRGQMIPALQLKENGSGFRSIQDWFQEAAAVHADTICLEQGERSLTYREVNEMANRLAHYIRKRGAGPEVPVGILLERSPEMVIAIIAVLKAGAAFVPISPAFPQERIAYIVSDTSLELLLTSSALEGMVNAISPEFPLAIAALDQVWEEIQQESASNPPVQSEPSDLAYIIYTSGSTGSPKGVMIEHRAIPLLATEQIRWFKLTSRDRVLQYASISFDASVSEIFTTLLAGAVLVLLPGEGVFAGEELHRCLHEWEISVVTLTPSVLSTLPAAELPHLKTIVSAGEACSHKLIRYWASRVNFINAYGPSESTVCTTMQRCTSGDDTVSIGTPIPGTAVYLLDKQLQPVNQGEIGELYISSVGLARGYRNAPELTSRSFFSNPFDDGFSDRLYKTGDLCRQTEELQLQWMGRVDSQVKISGIRIELAEVEYVLREYPGIEEAVVTVGRDAQQSNQILAYVKGADGASLTIAGIKRFLGSWLPVYMMPAKFMMMNSFPVLTSGKIDRSRLPSMDEIRPDVDTAYVEPRTPLEQTLCEIWCEILKINKVGIHDNFFDLGGQSLMATQMLSRIRAILGVDIPLHVIFNTIPTIEQTALSIEQHQLKQLEQLGAEELETLLSDLESLTEEEIKVLLAE